MKLNEIGIGERFEYDGNEYEKLSDAKNCEIYCYNYTKNASTYLPKYLKVTKVREEKERNAVEVWAEEVKIAIKDHLPIRKWRIFSAITLPKPRD